LPKYKSKEKWQKTKFGKQNFLCKDCGRQFIGDHALTYKGCHSSIIQKILLMLVRGIGIRDISVIEKVSIKKALSVLVNSNKIITPKQQYYDCLEVDEFWTCVGNKKNKVWLIYAYHRATGEIVSYVWGKRNYKTNKKLRNKLKSQGIAYDTVYTDKRDSFIAVFQEDSHIIGEENTISILFTTPPNFVCLTVSVENFDRTKLNIKSIVPKYC
jgi:IS1 family transposase